MDLKPFFIFLILFLNSHLQAAPCSFEIKKTRDYELLEKFFRISCTEEEYGYVLEGIKPISIRNVYHPAFISLFHYFLLRK